MTVTGVGLDRDGIPNVLHQPQLSYGAPVQYSAPAQYGAPVSYGAAIMTVTNIDLSRDGIPNVMQSASSWLRSTSFRPVRGSCNLAASPTITFTGAS